MVRNLILIFLSIVFLGCQESSDNKIAIVIHGGAGTIVKENITPELERSYFLNFNFSRSFSLNLKFISQLF